MSTTIIVDDILGEFGFRVVWREVNEYIANMEVYKVASLTAEGFPEFAAGRFMSDRTQDTNEAEVYLEGFIKWDGCTELDMGCPHWCSPEHYQQHCDLLKYLYHRAMELMGRQDEMEPWPNPSLIKENDECQIAYMGRND